MQKTFKVLSLTLAAATALSSISVLAATSHYADSTAIRSSQDWNQWTQDWNSVAADYTGVAMSPGRNETELNFDWMTPTDSANNAAVVYFGTSADNMQKYTGTVNSTDSRYTGGSYVSNKVTVTGLSPNTTYYYEVEKNGVRTGVQTYTTRDFHDVKMLYVGDPQIGASKGQPQNGEKLVNTRGVSNTAARNDGFSWNRTLNIASAQTPDLSFIISAGDQVNKTGKAKEEEFAAYLYPDALKKLPVATTIGNHDSLTSDYSAHFNVPNETNEGRTEAGGDYYYSYGDGLFIVLNTNNYNVAEHKAAMEQAIASDPDAQWRVVTIHQDIYGSGLDHSETDGKILRTQLTPLFDQFDIDVCLQGHDHTYSRSKLLYGDGQTHHSYKFQLNSTKDDYDWDHAYDTYLDTNILLNPAADDAAGQKQLQKFNEDTHCYTISEIAGNSVTDPEGTLYMTANSATGSKYYELNTTQQDYIAARSQNWLPSYSVIEMTPDTFRINTYQITDDSQVQPLDSEFTITKTR